MEGEIVLNKNEQYKLRIIDEFRFGKISRAQAAMLLGLSERTISRLARKVRVKGVAGIKHGNSKNTPHNQIDQRVYSQIIELLKNRYHGFNLVHANEKLIDLEGIKLSYSSLWRIARSNQIGKVKKRRKAKNHIIRERMAEQGMLLQMDGSPHKWNGKDIWCLILAIDDATSNIPYAEFFKSETTFNCMKVLGEIIKSKGIPQALYVDRAGWSGGGKRTQFSQFTRACDELGSRIIFANSAQAKGRVERSFKTMQDRLISELRLNNITSMLEANFYLQKVFLPQYWNKRLAVEPRSKECRYQKVAASKDLTQILCKKHSRQVRSNLTISYENRYYKVKKSQNQPMKGKYVEIREYPDGTWSVYYRQQQIEVEKVIMPKNYYSRYA